jgi:Nucleotidyl transferase AbiEii toxin, Type IV TA system
MDDPRLTLWETLFRYALDIIDEAARAGHRLGDWTFGGGTVLMRRYHHRVSKDVDIFVPDPQWLGYLTPRLNPVAEGKTGEYVEQAGFLKLYFPQGELDFVVAAPLLPSPWLPEPIMGRRIRVESSAEIMAKKLKHRGAELKARDLFDLAVAIEREPKCLPISTLPSGRPRNA